MRRGFTLVELSIVLVIIGLLIGGILVAQSMLTTARITSQVRQIQQFDIAINNFKTKYGALPGDAASLGCTVNNGNTCNNGLIETFGGGSWDVAEILNFWPDLSKTEMLKDGKIYSRGSGQVNPVAGVNMPAAVLNKNAEFMPYSNPATSKSYYFLEGTPYAASSPYNSGISSLTTIMAMELDGKMDDGNAWTGILVVPEGNNPSNINYHAGWWCVAGGGQYELSVPFGHRPTDYNCWMRIDMLSQTGNNE